MRSALERCVGDPASFARDVWGRQATLYRDADDDHFADVFDVDSLDRILTSSTRTPIVRVVEGGTNVASRRYTERLRLGGRWVDDVVDPRKTAALFAAGATVVAQSLHRTWPPVAAFVTELANDVSHPLQANAYLTPPHSVGLAAHRDEHDVIVLQLAGTKCWTIDTLGDLDLHPGDAMYLPAGTEHEATSTDQSSLHLTIGIIRVTYRQVLDRVLRDDALDLGRALPLSYRRDDGGDGELAANIAEVLGTVGEHLSAAPVDDIAATERSRRHRPLPEPGLITSQVSLDDLCADDVVRWSSPGAWIEQEHDAGDGGNSDDGRDWIHLRLMDRSLRLPASAHAAVERLMTGRPQRIADLDDLDEPSQLVVARRLIEESALVVVNDRRRS